MILYHGTSAAHADNILETGLTPGSYVSVDPKVAEHYAAWSSDPEILEICIDDTRSLTVPPDIFEPFVALDWSPTVPEDEIGCDAEGIKEWEAVVARYGGDVGAASLASFGWATTRRYIPPEDIRLR